MKTSLYLIFVLGTCLISPDPAPAGYKQQVPLYPIYENNRWGLIDPSGKVVLEPRFEKVAKYPPEWDVLQAPKSAAAAHEISGAEPVSDSVIPVRLDGKAGFATRDGKVLALGRYEDTDWRFSEGLVEVKSGGRYGYADEHGELVVPARYDETFPFHGGFAFVKVDKRWGIIDRAGNSVVPPTWDFIDPSSAGTEASEWIEVRIGKRAGVVDRGGNVILPVRFDKIANPTKPLISAVDSGRPVYVRPGGEIAFEVTCPKGLFRAPKGMGFSFGGKKAAIVRCGEGMDGNGLIDAQGKFLLDPTWDGIGPFEDGRSVVSKGGRHGIIDEDGRFVVELGKFKLCGIREGMVCFIDQGNSKVGFLDLNGNIVIPASFDWALWFQEGLAVARTDEKRPFGHGYIDRKGSWIIGPGYWRANSFKGPLATVEQPVAKDILEVSYIDRAGNHVYRMRFKGVLFPFFKGK